MMGLGEWSSLDSHGFAEVRSDTQRVLAISRPRINVKFLSRAYLPLLKKYNTFLRGMQSVKIYLSVLTPVIELCQEAQQ